MANHQTLIHSPDGFLESLLVSPSYFGTVTTMESGRNNTAEGVIAGENAITLYDLKGVEQQTFPLIMSNITLAIDALNQSGQPRLGTDSGRMVNLAIGSELVETSVMLP